MKAIKFKLGILVSGLALTLGGCSLFPHPDTTSMQKQVASSKKETKKSQKQIKRMEAFLKTLPQPIWEYEQKQSNALNKVAVEQNKLSVGNADRPDSNIKRAKVVATSLYLTMSGDDQTTLNLVYNTMISASNQMVFTKAAAAAGIKAIPQQAKSVKAQIIKAGGEKYQPDAVKALYQKQKAAESKQ